MTRRCICVDECDALPSPAKVHAAMVVRPTPENHKIKIFRLRLPKCLGG